MLNKRETARKSQNIGFYVKDTKFKNFNHVGDI